MGLNFGLRRFQVARVGLFCLGLCLLPIAPVDADPDRVSIKGSTTIQPVASDIGAAFQAQYSSLEVIVEGGGSRAGIRALVGGEVDIAASSSFISETDIREARENGIYPVPFRIAYDCILPIVNRSNPVTNLSLRDLQKIYRGEVENWRQLGGLDRRIVVISRDTESGTYRVWHETVMQQQPIATAFPPKRSNEAVVGAVADNPGAIGYVGLSHLNARIKPLRVDGVMGSTFSLKRGVYPLSRPLFLFTDGWPQGRTLEFINFVLDPSAGQAIISRAGYIPLN